MIKRDQNDFYMPARTLGGCRAPALTYYANRNRVVEHQNGLAYEVDADLGPDTLKCHVVVVQPYDDPEPSWGYKDAEKAHLQTKRARRLVSHAECELEKERQEKQEYDPLGPRAQDEYRDLDELPPRRFGAH